jgi:hypothetical protein
MRPSRDPGSAARPGVCARPSGKGGDAARAVVRGGMVRARARRDPTS